MSESERKYTKELLEPLVKSSYSIMEVGRKLGVKRIQGGSHRYLSRTIKLFGLDTSHFLGKRISIVRGMSRHYRKVEDIFVLNENKKENSESLLAAMLENGFTYSCRKCRQGKDWQDEYLRLHINHKNGNCFDNRKDNLELLCPNCHSQTKTYCRAKNGDLNKRKRINDRILKILYPDKFKERVKSRTKGGRPTKDKVLKYCKFCGVLISGQGKTGLCKRCFIVAHNKLSRANLRKVLRPSLEQLREDVNKSNYVQVGKKYGVSDNCIRKWFTWYGVDYHTVR